MRVFLVRHGESEGNVDPQTYVEMADHAIPLSERGLDQGRRAGELLVDFFKETFESPDRARIRMWNSPYVRARQTAQAIGTSAAPWLSDRREHVLLCEQQFGLFNGVPDDQLPKRFPEEYALYSKQVRFAGRFWARLPMGESRFDVAMRVHQTFEHFRRDAWHHGIDNLVVVCHGVTLRAFVMMWCDLSPEWFEAEPNPKNCAIRLLEGDQDRGYLFEGFGRDTVV